MNTPSAGVILLYSKSHHQRDDVELLVVKQRGGKWGLPKGHGNVQESLVHCAYRELYEETGVTRRQLQRCNGRLLTPLYLNNIYFVVVALQKRPHVAEFGHDCEEIECSQWCSHAWLLRSFNRRRYNRTLSEDSLLAIQRLYVKTFKNNPPSNSKRPSLYNNARSHSVLAHTRPPPPSNAWFPPNRRVCTVTPPPADRDSPSPRSSSTNDDDGGDATTNNDDCGAPHSLPIPACKYNEGWGRILYPPSSSATLELWHSDWRQKWHEQCTWQRI
jgi:8-oxo-dGTP pyrophosphatase MutT (NUDIX family)